jgi:1-acyl-sn-glycerol-3-phosphate acyltransferase
VEVNGLEHIDATQPAIFLPCHQNGLLDCLTLLSVVHLPIAFYAKSAFFKGKLMNKILAFLRIMPVYRGKENLQDVVRNEENFQNGINLLLKNYPLCIMPEGGQHSEHRLHNLAKGAFRIAFQAQQQLPQNQSVYLYPVGLDYGEYEKIGYPFILNVGKPIKVLDFMPLYNENPPKGINAIKDALYQALASQILNIRSTEYYQTIYVSSYLGSAKTKKRKLNALLTSAFKHRQLIENQLNTLQTQSEDTLKNLSQSVEQYLQHKPDFVLSSLPLSRLSVASVVAFVVLFLPLFIYGLVLNLPTLLIYRFLLHPKLKGGTMVATVKSVIYLMLSPVIHLIAACVLAFCLHSWWIGLAVFFTGMIVTAFTAKYFSRLRLIKAKIFTPKNASEKEIYTQIEKMETH